MKDIKFIIIILLFFFGAGIMAEINHYDESVNNTGIMYQENDNIVLNENNRFYDYDINYNLNESYLQYNPVKKYSFIDNSKNLAVPNLEDKEYLGDGVYRLRNFVGITLDYEVFSGIYTINGTNITANFNYIIFDIDTNIEYTLSYIAVSGTLSGERLNISIETPYSVVLFQNNQNLNKQNTFITTTQSVFRFDVGAGTTFTNYQFKLQLEKGSTATPYQVPYISALKIDFKGSNQVEYINPYKAQTIKINDINNVNNIEFELLNTINPVVFNWNITTNPDIPFVRFYSNQTKLLYDFTDIDEINNIGNNLLASQTNFLNLFDSALNLVDTFYQGFQTLFSKKHIDTIKNILSKWPLPLNPTTLPWFKSWFN